MASDKQYEVFKSLYDEEAERYTKLATRAQLYLSIITLYVAAFAFKFEDLRKFIDAYGASRYLAVSTAIVLVLALLATLMAIQIRAYEGIADPEDIIKRYADTEPSDADFLDARIADLAVATNRNAEINDRVATWLVASSWLLVGGVLLHLLMLAIAWLG